MRYLYKKKFIKINFVIYIKLQCNKEKEREKKNMSIFAQLNYDNKIEKNYRNNRSNETVKRRIEILVYHRDK